MVLDCPIVVPEMCTASPLNVPDVLVDLVTLDRGCTGLVFDCSRLTQLVPGTILGVMLYGNP